VRLAVRAVEVADRVREQDIINWNKARTRALHVRVIPELLVLTATHWKLSQQLFELSAVFRHLSRQLIVQVARLPVGAVQLLFGLLADNVSLHGAAWREQFLDRPRLEVNATFGQNGVDHLGTAFESSPARCIVTQARP